MNSLIFLTEKCDGTIKARACAYVSVQRHYITKQDATSPTVTTEGLPTTCVIEAKQGRDVMTLDIPNAFVQTSLPESNERIIMKFNGRLVGIMMEEFPHVYKQYVQMENKKKTLYVVMEKTFYGMMMSSLLFYQHIRKDLESIGFEVNPYNICVANRDVNGMQQTVTWHVDDVKVSHICAKANKKFYRWCKDKYGNNENGHVKVSRGKIHEYLAMNLNYTKPSKVIVDMRHYIKELLKEYPYELNKNIEYPWNGKLFENDNDMEQLTNEHAEAFHAFVMKCMFLA